MTFLIILIVALAALAVTMLLLLRHDDNVPRAREFHRATRRLLIYLMFAAGGASIVLFIITAFAAKYLAGQGDGPAFARQWVQRWHPAAAPEVECQELDSDDNGYITCTVGYDDEQGKHQLEAIECGVNRWYHGYRTTGCRLMRGYSGSQP